MFTPTASNLNFPAPLAVVGFLSAIGAIFLALGATLIFWLSRKRKLARFSALTAALIAGAYAALLLSFSLSSHATTVARGQEKYFCEIDCHLAYSILDVKTQPATTATTYILTLRTRFDENTISPTRPREATLAPSPREIVLIDASAHEYAPVLTQGTMPNTPLKPGESYTTQLEFKIPNSATGLHLLINTVPSWPDHLVIGDENSILHKKTFLSL